LSAGQAQRIGLARVFLRDARLVVLDEPTAHLDTDTGAAIAAAIRRLAHDRTILLIAHSPALVMHADHVIVLDEPAGEPLLLEAA
jgi:ABC-type multidrug transport system fused ATPase/permease subunit